MFRVTWRVVWSSGMLAALLMVASCLAKSDATLGSQQLATAQLAMAQVAYHGQEYGCSGVLVDPRWVLTAGHCIVEADGKKRLPARFQVRLLRPDRSDLDLFGVDQIVLARGYSDRGPKKFLLNDAALLHLDHGAAAKPVGLATADPAIGTTTELGWGCNPRPVSPCVLFSSQVKDAVAHVGKDNQCGMDSAEGKKLICADPVPSFGPGDSGGSMLIAGTNGPLAAGVISGHAGKFEYLTSITAVRDWINQTIG